MPKRLTTVLYWFLALEFAVGAVTKYWSGDTIFGPAYSVKFADWGYPSWMRFVVGALEGIAAVLLLVLTGAVTTHIVNHDSAMQSWAAPTYLLAMGIVALVNWPADWRDLLRTPVPTK